MDLPRKKRIDKFERRIREETITINGTQVTFYRCPLRRQWMLRAIDVEVETPMTEAVTIDFGESNRQDTN
jgi:hypothetical protein